MLLSKQCGIGPACQVIHMAEKELKYRLYHYGPMQIKMLTMLTTDALSLASCQSHKHTYR